MLRFFADPATERALAKLTAADKVTVFVGAGASKEVGLPTWAELVTALAEVAIRKQRWHKDQEWLKERISGDDLLGAAERVEILLGDKLTSEIRDCLYHDDRPDEIQPGPLFMGVAEMKKAFGSALRVVTTNYDQLLLTALRRAGIRDAKSYCAPTEKPGVLHLHGVIGYEKEDVGKNEVVLTQSSYFAPQAGGWRKDVMDEALQSPCLFLGASLTDLNLLQSLYSQSSGGTRHYVLFVRHPARSPEERRRRTRLEKLERWRWKKLNVEPLFADHYADVGQFAFEVAARRLDGSFPVLTERFGGWFERRRLVFSTDTSRYRANQELLNERLSDVLTELRDALSIEDEAMSLGVCALFPPDEEGGTERPINWVTSDRVMTTPETMEFLPLDPDSPWTVVKAICKGTTLAEPKDVYASRWRYLWAEPVQYDGG